MTSNPIAKVFNLHECNKNQFKNPGTAPSEQFSSDSYLTMFLNLQKVFFKIKASLKNRASSSPPPSSQT
ncbi:hypothetical protein TTHERM_00717830 (macronuclear) [Tetrahymena thermophila SB210]|uniref:Uncharacterized protein n=1 Tax=Tetrahymena thermophila (strain SB210) TaxID=312017 RepID=Q23E96_TETTS|nr:hypothetical protein TTHERM_00717830 [Tetrahymena thermophila SB210]EAR94857.1 hypothetical protein TTHERM_00717830 [Tetrahymena thermophila SB210]|eukprot:XP_001015102.1 hypothetical protein TTHERM_00717830 [Tetrahymena thermophila SB210]